MRFVGVQAWFMVLLVQASAFAQQDTDINTAYALAVEGLAAFNTGSYPTSFDRFSRAFAIVPIPSLALYLARTNVKLGHLLAARKLYTEVGKLPDGLGDPEVQQTARKAALSEIESLQASIPRITIRAPGVPLASVVIQVDSTTVPTDSAGTGWQVEPGLHQATVLFGGQKQSQQAQLAEGESKTFVFTFLPQPTPGAAPVAESHVAHAGGRTAVTNAGWVSLAIGGTALTLSGATSIWAISKGAALDKKGPWDVNHCERAPAVDDCQTYDRLRTFATVGFYTGIVGIATGLTLLLLPARARAAPTPKPSHLQPLVGVGYAGVQGQLD